MNLRQALYSIALCALTLAAAPAVDLYAIQIDGSPIKATPFSSSDKQGRSLFSAP